MNRQEYVDQLINERIDEKMIGWMNWQLKWIDDVKSCTLARPSGRVLHIQEKNKTKILCHVLVQCFFFTLCLRVNFRTLSTLWVLCRFEREEVEDCCCTKRKHARLSVCARVLKKEHRCRGTNVELFAYNDYVQLPASTLPTTFEIWVNLNTQPSVVSKIS